MAANTISPTEENKTQCYDDHVTYVNEHIKTLIQLPNMQLLKTIWVDLLFHNKQLTFFKLISHTQ